MKKQSLWQQRLRRHLTRRVSVNVEGQDGIGDILVGAGTVRAVRRVKEVHQKERAEERGKARKARPRQKGRIKARMMMDGVIHRREQPRHRQRPEVAMRVTLARWDGINRPVGCGHIGQDLIGGHPTIKMRCQSFLEREITEEHKMKLPLQALREGQDGMSDHLNRKGLHLEEKGVNDVLRLSLPCLLLKGRRCSRCLRRRI